MSQVPDLYVEQVLPLLQGARVTSPALTLHLTNWSSKKLHGPGRKFTIMAVPRQWEVGDGRVPGCTPAPVWLRGFHDGRLDPKTYRGLMECKMQHFSMTPGHLMATVGNLQVPVEHGDSLLCACSREDAKNGRCHRVWYRLRARRPRVGRHWTTFPAPTSTDRTPFAWRATMDLDPGRVPFIPDAADAPPGSKLLVRLRDEGRGRLTLADLWTQHGETFWLVELERLKPAEVVDAQLLTPGIPFGSVSWAELNHEERALLYYGAMQALCGRGSFERSVADAWVRAANKCDGMQESDPASLVNRVRRDALAQAKATIADGIIANTDIAAIVKSVDATKLMLDHLRSTAWDGGAGKLKALVRERLDLHVKEAVATELDAQLGDTFDYLRKGVAMAVNNAIGRLGAAGRVPARD